MTCHVLRCTEPDTTGRRFGTMLPVLVRLCDQHAAAIAAGARYRFDETSHRIYMGADLTSDGVPEIVSFNLNQSASLDSRLGNYFTLTLSPAEPGEPIVMRLSRDMLAQLGYVFSATAGPPRRGS